MAHIVDSIDAHVERFPVDDQIEVVLDAALPMGGRFLYVEGASHGPVIELIERPS